jgi:hypothetical protein
MLDAEGKENYILLPAHTSNLYMKQCYCSVSIIEDPRVRHPSLFDFLSVMAAEQNKTIQEACPARTVHGPNALPGREEGAHTPQASK